MKKRLLLVAGLGLACASPFVTHRLVAGESDRQLAQLHEEHVDFCTGMASAFGHQIDISNAWKKNGHVVLSVTEAWVVPTVRYCRGDAAAARLARHQRQSPDPEYLRRAIEVLRLTADQ